MTKHRIKFDAGGKTAIEEMRDIVNAFSWCPDGFNYRWSFEQLITLRRAWRKSEWDILPVDWTARQLREALDGVVPQWDDEENPVYVPQWDKPAPAVKKKKKGRQQ